MFIGKGTGEEKYAIFLSFVKVAKGSSQFLRELTLVNPINLG